MKLTGVRVIDLSHYFPGPLLCGTMADHGADVIKLEPHGGEAFRRPDEHGVPSAPFIAVNRGKRSIALDLKQPKGRAAALRLLDSADVVVESFRPGVAARLGVDYACLRQRNPRVVYCSLSAFGQDGPLAATAAHDIVVQALAGSMSADRPITDGPSLGAVAAAFAGLSGVLMALLRARETGVGDWIDMSMYDATLNAQAASVAIALRGQTADTIAYAMLGAYRTADAKWLCVGGRERHFATNLLEALGRPDLIECACADDAASQQVVRVFLEQAFGGRTRADWLTCLEGRSVSVAPVSTLEEALRHPHTVARGMILDDGNGNAHLGTPIKFSNEPGQPRLHTAQTGEDGAAILAELGYDPAQIHALQRTAPGLDLEDTRPSI